MVRGCNGLVRTADLQPSPAQSFEGLRGRDFMNEMEIDKQQGGGAGLLGHDVLVPNLFNDGTRFHIVIRSLTVAVLLCVRRQRRQLQKWLPAYRRASDPRLLYPIPALSPQRCSQRRLHPSVQSCTRTWRLPNRSRQTGWSY